MNAVRKNIQRLNDENTINYIEYRSQKFVSGGDNLNL